MPTPRHLSWLIAIAGHGGVGAPAPPCDAAARPSLSPPRRRRSGWARPSSPASVRLSPLTPDGEALVHAALVAARARIASASPRRPRQRRHPRADDVRGRLA
jgi:hypothetical protein